MRNICVLLHFLNFQVILWLVAPRDKSHFHPTLIEWLVNGLAKGTSKKSSDSRETELLDIALPLLCKQIEDQPAFWLENGSIGLVLQAVLKRCNKNISNDTYLHEIHINQIIK